MDATNREQRGAQDRAERHLVPCDRTTGAGRASARRCPRGPRPLARRRGRRLSHLTPSPYLRTLRDTRGVGIDSSRSCWSSGSERALPPPAFAPNATPPMPFSRTLRNRASRTGSWRRTRLARLSPGSTRS
jgi:hypothetical protein